MKVVLKNLIWIPLTMLLVACGGGGSLGTDDNGGGGGQTPDVSYSVSLSIVDSATGEANNQLSSATPLTVNATVTSSDGSSAGGNVVSFSFDDETLASFGVENGRAVVDSDGIASINLIVGENSGAGLVTATVGTDASAEIAFNSAGDGSQTNLDPASLSVYSSTTSLPSAGSDQIEIIALVKDEDNILLEGVDVSFSADSGALTSPSPTGPDGTARVTLTTQGDPQNRDINIVVSVGSLTQEITVSVVGTEVKIDGPSSVILQDTAEYRFILADSDGNGIAGEAVQLSSSNDNLFNPQVAITDQTGQVAVEYQAVNSGLDEITATALNGSISSSFPVMVQQDNFSFTDAPEPDEDVPLNTATDVTITWLTNGSPVVGETVSVSATRGSVSPGSGITDDNGQLTVSLQSASSGPVKVAAKGTHSNGDQVNSQIDFEYIATSVASIKVDATPDSIGPEQKSTITAVIRDAAGNLVKGKEIRFNTSNDATSGSLSAVTSVTDSNGLASVVYSSNTVSSEDGVTITATLVDDENISGSVSLTVGDRAFDISLGTGREIQIVNEATYMKTFVAFVTDSNSNPVENAELTISGTAVKYTQLSNPGDPSSSPMNAFYKGYWVKSPSEDDFQNWAAVYTVGCPNEDVDADGTLDAGEDTNGDGELTPGNVPAVTDSVITDENGQALIEVRYPKNSAPWVVIKITVSGQSAGTESKVSQFYTLGVAASDLTDEVSPPPSNPYGSGIDWVDDPDDTDPSDGINQIDTGNNRTCTNRL